MSSVRRGKQPQRKVQLPKGWWLRLSDWLRPKLSQPGKRTDIYEYAKISRRSFSSARKADEMTEELFTKLTHALGFENHQDLLRILGSDIRASRLATPVPTTLSLTNQRLNFQGADYRDYRVEAARPWALRCRIVTESPYFRFGFKLLTEEGRVFGDGVIQSHDENIMVHIGRNNWDRPRIGVTARDIFLTAYLSGTSIEENDRFLFTAGNKVEVPIELTVDTSYFANLVVDGKPVFRHVVSPAVCRRIAIYAWGDREEFEIDLTDLVIHSV
jgi:hypothetical protein